MKIAVPVFDESLRIFGNTGHAPYFAIFTQSGAGMFRQINLLELRANPRGNASAEGGCDHDHSKMSEAELQAHAREHDVLGELVGDCAVVLVKKACKNTAAVFERAGVKVCKMGAECVSAKDSFKFIKL